MSDQINPAHYKRFPVEVIEITEHLNFNLGNAVKYACRAGHKPGADVLTDLRKSEWYIRREIERLTRQNEPLADKIETAPKSATNTLGA